MSVRSVVLSLPLLLCTAVAMAQSGDGLPHVPKVPGPPCLRECTWDDDCVIYRRKYTDRDGMLWYEGYDCPEIVAVCNEHPEWRMCE